MAFSSCVYILGTGCVVVLTNSTDYFIFINNANYNNEPLEIYLFRIYDMYKLESNAYCTKRTEMRPAYSSPNVLK